MNNGIGKKLSKLMNNNSVVNVNHNRASAYNGHSYVKTGNGFGSESEEEESNSMEDDTENMNLNPSFGKPLEHDSAISGYENNLLGTLKRSQKNQNQNQKKNSDHSNHDCVQNPIKFLRFG